jgi:hypothetical protein
MAIRVQNEGQDMAKENPALPIPVKVGERIRLQSASARQLARSELKRGLGSTVRGNLLYEHYEH